MVSVLKKTGQSGVETQLTGIYTTSAPTQKRTNTTSVKIPTWYPWGVGGPTPGERNSTTSWEVMSHTCSHPITVEGTELPRRFGDLLCWDNIRALFYVLYGALPCFILMTTLWNRHCWFMERETGGMEVASNFPGVTLLVIGNAGMCIWLHR